MSKILTSADGTKIFADAVGDISKPSIIFMPGFGLGSRVFDVIFNDQLWKAHFYLVRCDIRGHGQSEKPLDATAYESKRFAEDFETIVQGFGLTKPLIAAWSFGVTYVADILAVHPPSYISGIIQITPAPYLAAVTKVAKSDAFDLLPALIQSTDMSAREVGAGLFMSMCSGTASDALRQACIRDVLSIHCEVLMSVLSRAQDEAPFLSIGRESDFPVLMINGGKDVFMVLEECVKAMESWRNLKVVNMEESSHTPWLDEPDRFREEVLGWAKKEGLVSSL